VINIIFTNYFNVLLENERNGEIKDGRKNSRNNGRERRLILTD
jgi:hypothetical protein